MRARIFGNDLSTLVLNLGWSLSRDHRWSVEASDVVFEGSLTSQELYCVSKLSATDSVVRLVSLW